MQFFTYQEVELTDGFLYEKEKLNREITIQAVYRRFKETGRIDAMDLTDKNVHHFWDSDVAKWVEGASYILAKYPDKDLEDKVEDIIDRISAHQESCGYFNSYFQTLAPEKRFTDRDKHELYCAGHLMEAAVAYAQATGKTRFLTMMETYADYIETVFKTEHSASFFTPGHEELELALVKLYRYTKKKKYLDLAAHFIYERGTHKQEFTDYNQSHKPCAKQTEAVGHAVRAVYLYSAMADLAKELGDANLQSACQALYQDIVTKKMYVTGGIGSCYIGETFSKAYDLPNEQAYSETCAGIGLMFFCKRMLALDNQASYADTIERVFYNGVMSGLSLDGKSFFYENPLEITMLNHFSNAYGTKRYPITQRVECFTCSCCPPNLNRLLPKLGEYVYGLQDDTLYVNQYASSTLKNKTVQAHMTADYPKSGTVSVTATGVRKIALRIPSWCNQFVINKPYVQENGYAIVENDGEVTLDMDLTPFAVRSHTKVVSDVGKVCVQKGPVVYCGESYDNGENLHALQIPTHFASRAGFSKPLGLPVLEVDGFRLIDVSASENLYERADKRVLAKEPAVIRLIPYCFFANRGETDMLTWFDSAD